MRKEYARPSYCQKRCFLENSQVVFRCGQKAKYELGEPVDHLRHRFLDLVKVAFWTVYEVENDFVGPYNNLKHHFLDVAKVAFQASQNAKMNTHGLTTARN